LLFAFSFNELNHFAAFLCRSLPTSLLSTVHHFAIYWQPLCHALFIPLSFATHPFCQSFIHCIANNLLSFPPFTIHNPTLCHSWPNLFDIHCQQFTIISTLCHSLPYTLRFANHPFCYSLPTLFPIIFHPFAVHFLPILQFTAHPYADRTFFLYCPPLCILLPTSVVIQCLPPPSLFSTKTLCRSVLTSLPFAVSKPRGQCSRQ
jgi:hypothetical protein